MSKRRTIPTSEYHLLSVGMEYHLYFEQYTVYVNYRINSYDQSLELKHEIATFKKLKDATKLLASLRSKDEIGPLVALKWKLPTVRG